jgi:hypothetical protein
MTPDGSPQSASRSATDGCGAHRQHPGRLPAARPRSARIPVAVGAARAGCAMSSACGIPGHAVCGIHGPESTGPFGVSGPSRHVIGHVESHRASHIECRRDARSGPSVASQPAYTGRVSQLFSERAVQVRRPARPIWGLPPDRVRAGAPNEIGQMPISSTATLGSTNMSSTAHTQAKSQLLSGVIYARVCAQRHGVSF